MIDFFALFHGHLESVDNLDFTAILSPKKSAKNWGAVRNKTGIEGDRYAPKGRFVFVCSRRRVRCSDMFRIGSGWLD
jgi:hypothetical protein